jgi:Lrp/AsnC family transcriptional regulator, leucine-responsive regulatory protein
MTRSSMRSHRNRRLKSLKSSVENANKPLHNGWMELDKKDHLIIAALQNDARQSLAALGKKIGLSQPAISERVKKLEAAGVIEGYAAKVNLQALGLPLQAVVRVQTTHEHITRYKQLFESMPQVLDAVRVTGEDCFVVRCVFAQPEDLEKIVDQLAAWGSVKTALVLSQVHHKTPTLKAAHIR